jgi:hypothetical protein
LYIFVERKGSGDHGESDKVLAQHDAASEVVNMNRIPSGLGGNWVGGGEMIPEFVAEGIVLKLMRIEVV